jgi:hypothetical protein
MYIKSETQRVGPTICFHSPLQLMVTQAEVWGPLIHWSNKLGSGLLWRFWGEPLARERGWEQLCNSFLWQNAQEKQLKRGMVYFGSQFQRFQSRVSWLHCLGLRWSQIKWWLGACGGRRCSPHGSQEAESKRGRVWEQDIVFKGTLPPAPTETCFLQLGPTF